MKMTYEELKKIHFKAIELQAQKKRLYLLCSEIDRVKPDDEKLKKCMNGQRKQIQNFNQKINREILRAEKFINTQVDEKDRIILRMRYLESQTFDKIGRLLHCDGSTAKRWHDRAIERVFKK